MLLIWYSVYLFILFIDTGQPVIKTLTHSSEK